MTTEQDSAVRESDVDVYGRQFVEGSGGSAFQQRSLEMPVCLPCGYVDPDAGTLHYEVSLYPMTGFEEDLLLTDNKKVAGHEALNTVLANCLQRVGTIEFQPATHRTGAEKQLAEKIVQGLLLGDRSFLLICLRWWSLKEAYTYRFASACPACQEEATHVLDLRDLEVTLMPEPERREYDVTLPRAQKVVRFRLLTVADERRLVRMLKTSKERLASLSLWLRITSLDGQSVTSPRDLQQWSTYDREALREEMDKVDGGVDVNVTLTCPECGETRKAPLGVGANFFLPSVFNTKEKRKRG